MAFFKPFSIHKQHYYSCYGGFMQRRLIMKVNVLVRRFKYDDPSFWI